MDFPIQVIINLAFHAVNGLLVFFLFKKIIKRNDISLSAAGLFLINSRSQKVINWSLEDLGILFTAFLVLFSLIFFVDCLERKNREKITTIIKPLLFLSISTGLYFFLRIKVTSPTLSALPPATYIFRALAVPLKGISQAFFPEELMIKTADIITTVAYPNFSSAKDGVNPYFSRVIVFDLLAYLSTIAILGFSFGVLYFFKKPEDKRLGKIIFFSLLFIATSFLPFIFMPGEAGYFSIFEPKNLYFATMGASLITVIFVFFVSNIFQRWKIQKKLFFGILAIIFLSRIL